MRLCVARKIFGITEIEGGFPHSEILGSKLVRSSPRLIAAYHVLHRLSAPRHPPNALMTLDCSHYRRPPPLPLGRGKSQSPFLEISERHGQSIEKTIFASNVSESAAVKPRPLQEIAQEPTQKRLLEPGKPKLPGDRRFQTGQDRIRFLFTM